MSGEAPLPNGPGDKKPILIGVMVLIALLLLGFLADWGRANAPDLSLEPVSLHGLARAPVSALPTAPAGLQHVIEQMARREAGRNGVLVRSVEDGWTAGFRGATTFPQGTLRRIWLGAALLDAVDRGELSLDQRVPLQAARRGAQQPRQQVGELLRRAVADDDRQAQDHILDGLNGPEGMARWLEDNEIGEVAYGQAYRDITKRRGRNGKANDREFGDGATPDGMAFGLAELLAGKLLSSSSTQLLLGYFTEFPRPGSRDLPGWQIRRMTGEKREADAKVMAANSAALIRSRDGRRFIVAVFSEGSVNPTARRDRIMVGVLAALEQAEIR